MDYIIFGLVVAIICSFPIFYLVFGKEDKCGRTFWDKFKKKK